MNRKLSFAPVVLAVIALSSTLSAQLAREAAIARAESLLKNLQEGKTADIAKEFDPKMKQQIPESRLQLVWPGLVSQFGAFKSITERREGLMQGRQAVELFLGFEKETIVQRTVFDAEGKISGLVFRPTSSSVLPPDK